MRRLALILLAFLVVAPAANAATKRAVFGLRAVGNNERGYFVYALTPGATTRGAVIVSNIGNAPGTVKLFTADATTGRTTGTVYETDKKPTGAGSWVTLSTGSVTLAPGGHKQVSFTVHVPPGQKAGQWVGGIVAETSHQRAGSKTQGKASVQINIRDLTIVAVQTNVPGAPIVKFSIGDVTTGGTRGFQQVIVHIANDGNVLAKPNGRVLIYDSSGKLVQSLSFTMDTFLPQTAIDYPVLLKKALAPGDYTATVRLNVVPTAGSPITVTAKPTFSVSKDDVKQVFTSAAPQAAPPSSTSGSSSSTPWALIGLIVAGLLVIALLVLWLIRRRKGGEDVPPPPKSPSVRAAEEPQAPVTAIPALPEEAKEEAPPVTPEPEPEPEPEPAASTRPPECVPYHFWEVAYERGEIGDDGVWRFPHRCKNCALEVMATDVADASAQAERL
ncbi:MAG TPA: DUF916 domain-containing protein [Gaiellaceae bacterium]|nr:DUF916 domain-containing protein [Gaiellaceae bacterium]